VQPVETQSAAGSPTSLSMDESAQELQAPAQSAGKAAAELTPFMRQWTAAKRENPDALLFFRMGDFYEMFDEDAEIVLNHVCPLLVTIRGDRVRPILP